jgi:hypothetical protein
VLSFVLPAHTILNDDKAIYDPLALRRRRCHEQPGPFLQPVSNSEVCFVQENTVVNLISQGKPDKKLLLSFPCPNIRVGLQFPVVICPQLSAC